jgi:tektin-3
MPDILDHNVSNHVVRSSGSALGQRNNYYNPARNQVYSRFSTTDWDASNQSNFHLSEKERSTAERLRTDAFQAVKSTTDLTRSRQESNTKKLANRVSDIAFWKEELVKEINRMERETANLEDHRRHLEQAFNDTETPLKIAQDCLRQREKRMSIDLVHDEVERLLSKEVELIKRCQSKMQKTLDKAVAQLKMDRAAQAACEGDAQDKHHSQGLDDRMYQLRNTSSRIGFHPGAENIDNTISVPVTWIKFTQENIGRSAKQREASERLRGLIDAVIRACANEMWNQFNAVNNAFNSRIQETTHAKNTLQAHLHQTNVEIRDVERTIDLLQQAIRDKEAPMKVAQTRLDERSRRINVELCSDPVMAGLQREVSEIKESVRVLKDKLKKAMLALNRLNRARSTLEQDIAVKENSLAIDSRGCMGLRKNMALDSSIAGPIFKMPLVS